jgi:2-haloacid dehalogenase
MTKIWKTEPAIVFDFGGVLIDWNPYYLYRHLLGEDPEATKRFLHAVDFASWNQENDRGRTVAQGTLELAARFPEYRELILAYDERYLEAIGGAIQPVVEILRTLKEQGYPLYGLSNWPAEKFAIVRPRYPFFAWFDAMVISGEVRLIKPDRAIFDLLLERVGRPAHECVYIDDHDRNITTARELGFQAIHYQSPEQLEAELREMGIATTRVH